jgi:hypothetical protein
MWISFISISCSIILFAHENKVKWVENWAPLLAAAMLLFPHSTDHNSEPPLAFFLAPNSPFFLRYIWPTHPSISPPVRRHRSTQPRISTSAFEALTGSIAGHALLRPHASLQRPEPREAPAAARLRWPVAAPAPRPQVAGRRLRRCARRFLRPAVVVVESPVVWHGGRSGRSGGGRRLLLRVLIVWYTVWAVDS